MAGRVRFVILAGPWIVQIARDAGLRGNRNRQPPGARRLNVVKTDAAVKGNTLPSHRIRSLVTPRDGSHGTRLTDEYERCFRFRARPSFEEGLRRTIAWYEASRWAARGAGRG